MNSLTLDEFNEKSYFKDIDGCYISISYDPSPENPFTFYDSLGTYLTWENRHISPSENHYQTALNFTQSALGEEKANTCKTMQDVLQALDQSGYAVRGIYRYEHGNVSYALGESNPYGDYWDSGAVGFAFVSPEKLKLEGMTKEQAIACMEGEMKEYSAWANGDVFLAERYDGQGVPMEVITFYGLNGFAAEYPDIEPIDLGDFPNLETYAEHGALTQELEGEWTFRYGTKWRHDAYIKDPMAIVSDEMGDSWRIVNMKTAHVSFDSYDTPQEALKVIKQHEAVSKEELQSFIPPKELLEKPLDDLMREAKEKVAEKNDSHTNPAKERKSPEIGL